MHGMGLLVLLRSSLPPAQHFNIPLIQKPVKWIPYQSIILRLLKTFIKLVHHLKPTSTWHQILVFKSKNTQLTELICGLAYTKMVVTVIRCRGFIPCFMLYETVQRLVVIGRVGSRPQGTTCGMRFVLSLSMIEADSVCRQQHLTV